MNNSKKISLRFQYNLMLKTFTMLVMLAGIFTQQVLGQVSDNFSDGDLTLNPAWSGSLAHFTTNPSQQLQLNATAAGTSQLSFPFSFTPLENVQWEFYVKQTFAGSASNYSRIYLASSQQDFTGPLNGYYLQLGEAGSNDAVELFRQTGSASLSVCRATQAQIATSVNARIRVTRTYAGTWSILIDYAGGTNFIPEATGLDNTHTSASFFGIRCTYTLTNTTRFFYDDLSITNTPVPDSFPPELTVVNVHSATTVDLQFSESLHPPTAEDEQNYLLSGGNTNSASATLQADARTVRLVFDAPFRNGYMQKLSVKNIEDLAGNAMTGTSTHFMFFQPVPAGSKDIIFTEIFADPGPPVALPEAEFLEVHNRSTEPFDLSGWQVTDGSTTGNLTTHILLPGQYLILSSTGAASSFSPFGKVMGVSPFPSLNNASDVIRLKDQHGKTIDSVSYSAAWYRDDDKRDGGWTLELIDPYDHCKDGANWIASKHETGGTPGAQNAVFAHTPDITGPRLVSVTAVAPDKITLTFDEKLSAILPPIDNFGIEPAQEIRAVAFTDATLTSIDLLFTTHLDSSKTYTLSVQHIFDCPGNVVQPPYAAVALKLDTIAPKVALVTVISARELAIGFSEKLQPSTAQDVKNFQTNDSGGITAAELLADQSTVKLSFSRPLVNGYENTIVIREVADLPGNLMRPTERKFMFFQPVDAAHKDLMITEIFADPAPPYQLPEAEFVEIFNRSANPFALNGWSLSDGTTDALFTDLILLPGTHLIVCPLPRTAQFSAFGKTMGTIAFPSLNNSGDTLVLRDARGITIDSVNYSAAWYNDSEKKDGGWTLELIDPENLCAEAANWTASEDERGGTPGTQNSVFASKPDLTGPKLLSVFPVSETVLLLQFDEKLEKRLPPTDHFSLAPEHQLLDVSFASPALTSVYLSLSGTLQGGVRYRLTAKDVYDCAGNTVQPEFSSATFALPERADSTDVVINEILFNPRPTGVDFVEIFNRSAKFINLKHWKLGNLENGAMVNEKLLFENDFLLAPETWLVLTADGNTLKGEYLRSKEETFVHLSMPSFPDDEGSVALANEEGKIIDAFSYTDKLHSVFIKEDEGVSLERISMQRPADDVQNWKSASADAGFATPGYLNSNARTDGVADEAVSITPEIFVPMTGNPDFAQIRYNFDHGGLIANIRIFDARGREIKQIANNELLGTEGSFRWDGDLKNGTKARIGAYMVWVEVFDGSGMVRTFRKRVVVAGEF